MSIAYTFPLGSWVRYSRDPVFVPTHQVGKVMAHDALQTEGAPGALPADRYYLVAFDEVEQLWLPEGMLDPVLPLFNYRRGFP